MIGRQGRIARALQTLVRASGGRRQERALLEIVDARGGGDRWVGVGRVGRRTASRAPSWSRTRATSPSGSRKARPCSSSTRACDGGRIEDSRQSAW